LNDQTNDPNTPATPQRQAPDFRKVRSYLRTDYQRDQLDEFIKAGWTAPELAEHAREWRFNSKTYPTASAYQFVIEWGPEHWTARSTIKHMREPGYVMPPFDRPDPMAENDPENTEHSAETRTSVEALARLFMARTDWRFRRPRRGPETPIERKLWKSCYDHIKNYGSLERAIKIFRLEYYV
jgi:hypothetical protein